MSDLVGNPKDRFSRVEAHIEVGYEIVYFLLTCFSGDILQLQKMMEIRME